MKVYSVLLLTWREEFMAGAGPLGVCSSLEQAKEKVKKEVDSRRYELLCFKFNEDGTGAKSTLCNDKGEKEEIRIFVSDIGVAPERLKHLDLYINYILVDKIVFDKAYDAINNAIEANKVKVMFEGTKFEHTSQTIKDDELAELWKFYEKVQYTNPPRVQYNDPPGIYYIDSLDEQNINPMEKTSFF